MRKRKVTCKCPTCGELHIQRLYVDSTDGKLPRVYCARHSYNRRDYLVGCATVPPKVWREIDVWEASKEQEVVL